MTRPKASWYDLYVGNLGHVATIRSTTTHQATDEYAAYVELSKAPFGRASGETVTLFRDGQIFLEHQPKDQHE